MARQILDRFKPAICSFVTSSNATVLFESAESSSIDPMPDQRRRQRTSTMRIQRSSILLWSLPAMAGAFHMPATPTIRADHSSSSNPGGSATASRRTSTFGYASSKSTTATPTTALHMLGVTYPSFDEMIAGGERYEMVPLPIKCAARPFGWAIFANLPPTNSFPTCSPRSASCRHCQPAWRATPTHRLESMDSSPSHPSKRRR